MGRVSLARELTLARLQPFEKEGGARIFSRAPRHTMLKTSSEKRKRVLFVDDDPSLLRLGRLTLERAGYSFVGALDGREGLRQARAYRPDVIILDYMMPDISGKEVFRELIEGPDPHLRHTPVIMLTARTNNDTEQREMMEMGLAAYLHKPFGYRELLNIIDNVLVLSQIRDRNRVLELEARRAFVATVRTLVGLLFAKDSYTGQHSQAVARLAEGLALACGMSEEEATYVKLGALLHDVGKIVVPETVLCKPDALTADEQAVIRRHVYHGEQALAGVPHMEQVCAMIAHHHEWWNGAGYPAGLAGEEIVLGARIISVVDAYDAMTSDRPYRARLPQAVAVERLRLGAGTQFDPIVVGAFFDYLSTHEPLEEQELDLQFLEELCVV